MLGFATDYAGESASVEEMYRTLSDISEAGFSHIHWTHEWSGDYTYSVYEMIQIREWMDALGLKSKGLHATEQQSKKYSREIFVPLVGTGSARLYVGK